MQTYTEEQIQKIKTLHQEIVDNLNLALEGVENTNEPGALQNPQAPCLISQAVEKQIEIEAIINEGQEVNENPPAHLNSEKYNQALAEKAEQVLNDSEESEKGNHGNFGSQLGSAPKKRADRDADR